MWMYTTVYLSIYKANELLDSLRFWAPINNAAVNIHRQGFEWT